MNNVYIIYEDDIYEISKYITKHPGEGISNVYLARYNRKNITSDFNKYHMTDEAYELFEKVKNEKSYNGINYICKNYFQNRIPQCFYYNKEDLNGITYLESNNIVLIWNDNYFLLKYKINNIIFEDKILIINNKFLYSKENTIYNTIEIILNKIKKELI